MKVALSLSSVALCCLLLTGSALAQTAPAPGECATGFCGTPNHDGGGCGCGCGGSILVNNTDIGLTYSKSDDFDQDGLEDDFDNCPFNNNGDQADTDADGIGNACDNAPSVANADQKDTDGDGIGDVVDPDIDGDGHLNAADNCQFVVNVDQSKNVDGDQFGDVCDPDIDGDGIPNATDACPMRSGTDTSGGGCVADADADGIADAQDNCISVANSDQANADGDTFGDACDVDVDGDGIANRLDNCSRVPNPDQADGDRDGGGDKCDNKFCFVAAKNPAAACLDPDSAFQVTAGPSVNGNTGESLFLAMYANRQNKAIRYTFTILERPANSTAVISNPRGTAQTSEVFEYHFDDSRRPTFSPDVAGSYKISVSGELVEPDDKFQNSVTADSFATVEVAGPSKSKGCSATGGVELAWLASALAMAVRRYRRK